MTYRLPSLNTLRAFEAAARHLSFKTAAIELGVTAGAVSQQAKKLENSLGVELFRRLPHGLLLTPEGEAYLPKISRVFEDLTDATETIAPKVNSKKFKIGVCPDVHAVLPVNWPRSDDLSSHIRETIQTSDVQLIRANEIDCLLRFGGGPYGELFLATIPNFANTLENQQELHFICKPGLANCRQSKAILADLLACATASS